MKPCAIALPAGYEVLRAVEDGDIFITWAVPFGPPVDMHMPATFEQNDAFWTLALEHVKLYISKGRPSIGVVGRSVLAVHTPTKGVHYVPSQIDATKQPDGSWGVGSPAEGLGTEAGHHPGGNPITVQ